MYQRYVGFDSSERYWLYVQEAAKLIFYQLEYATFHILLMLVTLVQSWGQ